MFPVVGIALGAGVLSAALVGAVAVTEESCAPSRRSYIKCVRSAVMSRMQEAKKSDDKEAFGRAQEILQDVRRLEKRVSEGWTTTDDAAALARVTAYSSVELALLAARSVADGVTEFFEEVGDGLGRAFGWIVTPPNTPRTA